LDDIQPNLVVCNINCRPVIEELLSSAEHSITIQTQYISDDAILQILREKSMLADFDMKLLLADTDDNKELVRYFGKNKARTLKKPYNHSKMILIDGKVLLL
jgi:phosphatidylserine/phosphatidylglycerophosphate/cardiolipin synthase-like enzyme